MIELNITATHCNSPLGFNPVTVALLEQGYEEVKTGYMTVQVIKGGIVKMYLMSVALAAQSNEWDRTGKFKPGSYALLIPPTQ